MDLGACKSFDEKVCGHFSPLSARGGLSFKFSRFYRSAKNEVFRFGEFSIAGGNARAAETGDGRRKMVSSFRGRLKGFSAAGYEKTPRPSACEVLVSGGRRGIRTLDALNGHAAFPGRYNQPLCHPSMMCSAVSCSAVVKAFLQVGQVPETEKQEYTKERKVCHE